MKKEPIKPEKLTKEELEVEDKMSQRKHQKELNVIRYIFATVVVTLFFGFIITAISLDKDELVSEIIKAILYVCCGAFGSYGISKVKKIPQK